MKKYGKLLAGVGLLIILVVGSGMLYGYLSDRYRPDSLAQVAPDGEDARGTDAGASDESRPEDESEPKEADNGNPSNAADAREEAELSPAPDFTVVDADGEQVKLSDFVGKPVVLNFWASWCGPCKSEMPGFQNLYDSYGGEVAFVLVNLTDGSRETKETAMAYVEEQGYTFPVYFDVEQEAAMAYYVSSIPATYFIDSEGYLVAYGMGALREEDVITGLEMIMTD